MKKHEFWITLLIRISIFLALIIFTVIIYTYKAEASDFKNVSFAECKCNHTLYFLRQAELMQKWEDENERKYKESIDRTTDGIIREISEDNCKAIFGYIPSPWEINLLKRALTAECGYSEPDIGIERVLCVIANRCRRSGGTIRDVLSAPGQFETWSNGRIRSSGISDQVERAVEDSIRRGSLSDRSIMYFTAGRYNEYCRPGYIIGHHYFGY